MPTCGYLCPKCEGKGFLENLEVCDWCSISPLPSQANLDSVTPQQEQDLSDEEWIKQVHGKCSCSDIGLE